MSADTGGGHELDVVRGGGDPVLARVRTRGGRELVCTLDASGARALPVSRLSELLGATAAEIESAVRRTAATGELVDGPGLPTITLLAPVDGRTEVWASGVTYERSREARAEESADADVYRRVYGAERPELFLKALAHKVVGPGGAVGIRADSGLDVPEPELALVVNRYAQIVGYTICNDVSSRSIEGENPLYLPQAKIYERSCALGPVIRPAWTLDPADLSIELTITRSGRTVFSGGTRTSRLRRTFPELVAHLCRAQTFDEGVVLATGTGVVPDLHVRLHPDDEVTIAVEGIGELVNSVALVGDAGVAMSGDPGPASID